MPFIYSLKISKECMWEKDKERERERQRSSLVGPTSVWTFKTPSSQGGDSSVLRKEPEFIKLKVSF